MTWLRSFWPVLVALAIPLGLYGLYKIAYPTYSCRYRLTMSVEVDGQIRSASVVNEATVTMGPVILPDNVSFLVDDSGEAVFLDLGNGRNLVALFASGEHAEKLGVGAYPIFKHFHVNPSVGAEAATLASSRGDWELAGDDLPTLATFADPSRSDTIRIVKPDQLECIFGPNVHWRGVRIEMTRDWRTHAIERHLPWVTEMARGLYGQTFHGDWNKFVMNGVYFRKD